MADHSLTLVNCKSMDLTGVNNVVNFDEKEIMLETSLGYLAINGEDLHITMLSLDQGKLAIQGIITSMEYKPQGTDLKAKSKNVLNRLFK